MATIIFCGVYPEFVEGALTCTFCTFAEHSASVLTGDNYFYGCFNLSLLSLSVWTGKLRTKPAFRRGLPDRKVLNARVKETDRSLRLSRSECRGFDRLFLYVFMPCMVHK
jgi:hypothetical protein